MDGDSVGGLFRAAAAGDAAAWKSLVTDLTPLVWAVIRAHRLPDADAHDVYQTTWFRLTQNLSRIREPEKVASWLASTARNECLKIIRGSRRLAVVGDPELIDRASDDLGPADALIEAEDEAAKRARMRQLWEAFEELGESCRRLLRVLMASPPPSYREVSAGLGIAVGSIGPLRKRCLERLRLLLAGRGIA